MRYFTPREHFTPSERIDPPANPSVESRSREIDCSCSPMLAKMPQNQAGTARNVRSMALDEQRMAFGNAEAILGHEEDQAGGSGTLVHNTAQRFRSPVDLTRRGISRTPMPE